MKTIALDLVAPPRAAWPAWLLLMGAAGAAAIVGNAGASLLERRDELQARRDLLELRLRPARSARAVAAPDPELAHRIEQANRVIDELAVPWPRLFAAVEAADAPGIRLVSLAPNARQGTLALGGEADSMPALMAYVGKLAAQPLFGRVHLTGFENAGGAAPLRFTLAMQWKAGP